MKIIVLEYYPETMYSIKMNTAPYFTQDLSKIIIYCNQTSTFILPAIEDPESDDI